MTPFRGRNTSAPDLLQLRSINRPLRTLKDRLEDRRMDRLRSSGRHLVMRCRPELPSGRQDLNLRPLDPQITANRSRSASCEVKWHVRAAPGLLRGLALLYFAAVQPPQLVASVVHCPKPVPGGTGAWWTSSPAAPCEVSQGQLVLTCRAAPTRSSTDGDSTGQTRVPASNHWPAPWHPLPAGSGW